MQHNFLGLRTSETKSNLCRFENMKHWFFQVNVLIYRYSVKGFPLLFFFWFTIMQIKLTLIGKREREREREDSPIIMMFWTQTYWANFSDKVWQSFLPHLQTLQFRNRRNMSALNHWKSVLGVVHKWRHGFRGNGSGFWFLYVTFDHFWS